MIRSSLCLCVLICAAAAAACAGSASDPVLGVIVTVSASALPGPALDLLAQLPCRPEILCLGEGDDPALAFGFDSLAADLDAYSARGLDAAATVTAHVRTVPISPMADASGALVRDRHNPFDPAFLSEWRRLNNEFRNRFARHPSLRRVYVAPPSYFGEIEYFTGHDWARPRFLAYDPLARARFAEWLEGRYGSIAILNRAWGTDLDAFSDAAPDRPLDEESLDDRAAWLDFMEWRVAHLAEMVAREARNLAEGAAYRVGVKVSWGDTAAASGTHTAAILSQCCGLSRLALHTTNPHSLSDLAYAANLARLYGVSELILENDGNRYGRTELAKILFGFLLKGGDVFNFAYHAHLLHAAPSWQASETWRTLLGARDLFARYDLQRHRSRIVFLQSETTRFIRAPSYLCRDVAVVYDTCFVNAVSPHEGRFAWGRRLGFPDVTGEQAILDGDLEGRSLLILPGAGACLLPEEVWDRIAGWISAGGVMVVFGGREGLALLPHRSSGGRRRRLLPMFAGLGAAGPAEPGWRLPEAGLSGPEHATSAWPKEVLTEGWTPWLTDGEGAAVAAARDLGAGRLIVFADPVPVVPGHAGGPFMSKPVPTAILALAEESGAAPEVRVVAAGYPRRDAPLALGYAGFDRRSGRHILVGGGYDGTAPVVTVTADDRLRGDAELILVDLDRVAARGQGVRREPLGATQAEVYRDPMNTEQVKGRGIPSTVVRFTAPAEFELALEPFFPSADVPPGDTENGGTRLGSP